MEPKLPIIAPASAANANSLFFIISALGIASIAQIEKLNREQLPK
jgi:hypothetical protein